MSRSLSVLSWVPIIQGVYYIASGVWPLASMPTFLDITGPKEDYWLVRLVALLLVIIGLALAFAGIRRRITPEVVLLGIGTALVVAGIDIFYAFMGVILPIYFADAVVELALVAGWILGGRRRPRIEVQEEVHVKTVPETGGPNRTT